MKIIVKNDQKNKKINTNKVKKKVEKILEFLNVIDDAQVGILLVDNKQIHVLNKQYRNVDCPTDVISFAMQEGEGHNYPDILGDVVISIERTISQAKTYKHSFEEEFDLLLVHGVLHLLGYDHMKKKDEKHMKAMEQEILKLI
ncbi:rRNA maturation RNase YbeY [Candidatus Poribacteria bacterium]|nr:rRNA maturation RNase YbeY [Candidatus Poribacteria bacterium]